MLLLVISEFSGKGDLSTEGVLQAAGEHQRLPLAVLSIMIM